MKINPLNAELNPICCLLALLGAHHIFHVSRIRVNACLFNCTLVQMIIWFQPCSVSLIQSHMFFSKYHMIVVMLKMLRLIKVQYRGSAAYLLLYSWSNMWD